MSMHTTTTAATASAFAAVAATQPPRRTNMPHGTFVRAVNHELNSVALVGHDGVGVGAGWRHRHRRRAVGGNAYRCLVAPI